MNGFHGKFTVLGWLGALLVLIGCAANEPFDPDSLANLPPVVRLFVAPGAGGEELNPTSYFDRTFNWSGSDADGFVEEFYISIRTDGDNPAPWDTTTSTDTTLTFVPDQETGEASATFLLACRDNRGAYSDTLQQFVPMRNHPPIVNFQSNFEPLQNMQRELVYDGATVVDTVYWNWGASNFRFNAYDLDGLHTMDDYFRYTTMDEEPTVTRDWDDPAADPETGWVRVPFEEAEESYEFEVLVSGLAPGQRTLTVSVRDEAAGDPRFQYSWEVREPKSPVLYIGDNTSSVGRELYGDLLDQMYGAGNWDQYDFVFGFPDKAFVLLETMRLFDAVLWTDGGSTSEVMSAASNRDGPLEQYIIPPDGQQPGHLLLISRMVTGEGGQGPSPVFIGNVLGINAAASSPVDPITNFMGRQAQPQAGGSYLPFMTGSNNFGQGRGMDPNEDTEVLYRMEYCLRCYGSARPPFDPVVGIRRPTRDTNPEANVVCFSLQLEYFDHDQVVSTLEQVLTDEMGVAGP